jgi:hypothetical protein
MDNQAATREAELTLKFAQREASFEHAAEYAPITKGPIVAIAGLLPLCSVVVFCMAWRMVKSLVVKSA